MRKSANIAAELTSSSEKNALLMAEHAESVEEAIILQKFVCSVDEKKSLTLADRLTQW